MYPSIEYATTILDSFDEQNMLAGFRPPLFKESLELYYQDGELMYLCWGHPQTLLSVANPAVELLPFEQIEENIRKYFKYTYSRHSDEEETEICHIVDVSEIGLSYLPSSKKDDIKAYYWAPVWAVVYTQPEFRVDTMPFIMYINAIDGTLVSFERNYY